VDELPTMQDSAVQVYNRSGLTVAHQQEAADSQASLGDQSQAFLPFAVNYYSLF
jgi:hypothetical protein